VDYLPVQSGRDQVHHAAGTDREGRGHIREHARRDERAPLAAGEAGVVHLPIQADNGQLQPAVGIGGERRRQEGDGVERNCAAPRAADEAAVPDAAIHSAGDQLQRIARTVQNSAASITYPDEINIRRR
jgi:hypothetical protein